jgi:hypothetical protein
MVKVRASMIRWWNHTYQDSDDVARSNSHQVLTWPSDGIWIGWGSNQCSSLVMRSHDWGRRSSSSGRQRSRRSSSSGSGGGPRRLTRARGSREGGEVAPAAGTGGGAPPIPDSRRRFILWRSASGSGPPAESRKSAQLISNAGSLGLTKFRTRSCHERRRQAPPCWKSTRAQIRRRPPRIQARHWKIVHLRPLPPAVPSTCLILARRFSRLLFFRSNGCHFITPQRHQFTNFFFYNSKYYSLISNTDYRK